MSLRGRIDGAQTIGTIAILAGGINVGMCIERAVHPSTSVLPAIVFTCSPGPHPHCQEVKR